MLVSSIALIIQSLVLKQEKIVEFDWAKEKPAILLILGMCVYIGLMLCIGYVLASLIVFPLAAVLRGRAQARSLHRGSGFGRCHLPAVQERL